MPAGLFTQLTPARVLVADDQPHILTALEMLLHGEGYETDRAVNPGNVLRAMQEHTFDVVLMDLNYTRDTTGGGEGLELVTRIREIDETTPLVAMTAWGNIDLAVDAMRRGASDFVQKPWSNRELLQKLREQVERGRLLRASQRRREAESSEASAIQQGLLPRSLPQIVGYDISAISQSAHSVGGDYYNVVPLSEMETALCIADVAGKSFPGALLMSNLQASLKSLIHRGIQPADLCARLNRTLCEIMPENKFISMFYGVLDSSRNCLTYCNAGHNPPLCLRSGGEVVELESSGAVLGRFPQWQYAQKQFHLAPEESLVLFTDGIVEAVSSQNDFLGEDRLAQFARESANAETLMQRISSEGWRFKDDATLLVLHSRPQVTSYAANSPR